MGGFLFGLLSFNHNQRLAYRGPNVFLPLLLLVFEQFSVFCV